MLSEVFTQFALRCDSSLCSFMLAKKQIVAVPVCAATWCVLLAILPTVTTFSTVSWLPAGKFKCNAPKVQVVRLVHRRTVALRVAEPWDLTGQAKEHNDMFNMPSRNETKMGEATATLRREFKDQMAESLALPGFLRGALDPLRLKRNVKESRIAYLSRMFKGKDGRVIEDVQPAAAAEIDDIETLDVPTTLDEVLIQAQTDFATATAMGAKRMRLDILVPGLNEQIESRFPFDAPTLIESALRLSSAIAPLRTTILMDSPGTAAMAQAYYEREYGGELCPHVKFAALSKQRSMRDKLNDSDDAGEDLAEVYLVVRPKSVRGDQVLLTIEKAVSKAPDSTWVLVNPLLEDTVDAYTFGIIETDRRRSVLGAFEQVYSYRGLYKIARPALIPSERGALLKRWGHRWQVLKLAIEGYSLLREFDRKPDRSQLSSLNW